MPPDRVANPLLLEWVKEWWDTANERKSKGVITYKHAYDSLKACPITFSHPSELQQLKGFGPKLCDRLTEKMKSHCEANGLPMPKRGRKKKRTLDLGGENVEGEEDDDPDQRPAKKPRKLKAYVPAFRSGAYALVLGMATLDEDARAGLTKAELIEVAQPHCDSSFTAPSDPTKFYTAWNSMRTLLDKDLASEKGRPLRKYMLTDEGWNVAKRIQAAESGQAVSETSAPNPPLAPTRSAQTRPRQTSSPSPELFVQQQSPSPPPPPRREKKAYDDVVGEGPAISEDSVLPTFRPIKLRPGSFSVHLLLDVREVRSRTDRDYMQEELTKQGVKPIMRSLELGDAQWVAKCNDPNALSQLGAEGDEVVLDWIVERKRLDDLVSSIKDGRFHEQKFRLRRSGVINVVYIIEEISMDANHFQKYEDAVQSAIASTQVVNGYFVKKTQKMDETIRYLARMTAMLKKLYEGKALFVIPTTVLTAQNYLPLLKHLREKEPGMGYYISYPAFASLASKSDVMTLRDVFLKMLMTTRGVTGEKALEIQKCWKTPIEFVKAFQACGVGEQGRKKKMELVATRMAHFVGRKKIAKAISQRIAEVWGDA
jgi:crossover junction endonuclease MUS81